MEGCVASIRRGQRAAGGDVLLHARARAAVGDGRAGAGQALNRAVATDALGRTSIASAVLRISQDNLAARMTLIGRVTDGGCDVNAEPVGIPGVRLVLEDGSFGRAAVPSGARGRLRLSSGR